MENIDHDLVIKSITAVPRSRNFYNFYLNGTPEKRSMKLSGLAEFITNLCPVIGGRARIMIYEFRSFYIEIETQTLIELEEIPKPSEPHRTQMFSGVKKTTKVVREEQDRGGSFVDKRRQAIFGNILKLINRT